MSEPDKDTTAAPPVTFLQHLSVEIDRLTTGDRPERAKAFAALIRSSCSSWDQSMDAHPLTTRWALLEARVARIDATERVGSEEHRLKLQPLIRLFQQLLTESDVPWLRQCPRRRTLCRRFADIHLVPDLASGDGKTAP